MDVTAQGDLPDPTGMESLTAGHLPAQTELRALRARMRELARSTIALTHQVRPDSLPQTAVDLARTVTDSDYAALILLDPATGKVGTFLYSGLTPAAAGRMGKPPEARGLLRVAMTAERALRLSDLKDHAAHAEFPPHHPAMTSFLGVPIAPGGRPQGLLVCTDKRNSIDFTAEDEEFALRLAETVAETLSSEKVPGDALVVQLAVASQRMRELEAEHWSFLGSLSHDLRSPISGILMSSEILADPAFGAVDEARTRAVATRIGTVARNLMSLVDDLLDLSRIQARRFEVTMTPLDIHAPLHEAIATLTDRAAEAGVLLDAPPDDVAVPRVLADPVRLQRVLVNLLTNAIKFTRPGGHVWIELSSTEHDVSIAVCDTGIGIEEGDLDRIFEPFERVPGARAEGTGLGLAIARGIVEVHGGRLEVSSWPGVGSRFVATFRAARARHQVRGRGFNQDLVEQGEDLARGGGTVLLLEDDPTSQASTLAALTAAGYEVRAVSTCADALAAMAENPADLVLLDVGLPDGSGLDIVQRLRELAGDAAVRIIGFTADRVGDTEARGRALCDDFLLKPVPARELLRRVGAAPANPRETPGLPEPG